MVGTDKSLHAFGSASCPHLSRFRKFCEILSECFGIPLVSPEFSGVGLDVLSSLKGFCSGLIERRNHPWSVSLRRLGIRQRMSVAHSLFLFRKTLPAPEPNLHDFLDQISKPSPDPPQEFLDFCSREIAKMFPRGWDRNLYPNACLNSVIGVSSCVEKSRMFGGCRRWVLDNKMPDISSQDDFVEHVLSSTAYSRPKPSKLVSVDTGGKWRKITVPSGELSKLRPLHTALYDHLSKFDWLLRGDAKASVFSSFVQVTGELFVSGDYESATDFLNSNVSKHVLSHILMRSNSVPTGIRMMAMDSLSLPVSLKDDGLRVEDQRSGQMMGYLLSFPLLCLINYLTFRYAIPRDVPVKINGDDIVFRSTPEERDRWVKLVGSSGLKLSIGKTMMSRRFFTLNSTLFEGRDKVIALPFIRSTALFLKSRNSEMVMGLRGRYNSFCPGFTGEKRSGLRVQWLKLNRCMIDVTRRSITRGLGFPVTFDVLVRSGLWDREAWYLSLETESPIPAPISDWACKPIGYKHISVGKITKEMREIQKGVGAAFVASAWKDEAQVSDDDWFKTMRINTFDHGYWLKRRSSGALKRAKLLGLSVANTRRFLRPSRSLFKDEYKAIKFGLWVPEDYKPDLVFWKCSGEGFSKPCTCPHHVRSTIICPPLRSGSTDASSEDPFDNIDYRDYFKPTVSVDEVFVDDKFSITSRGEDELTINDLGYRLKSKGDLAVRVFTTGGVGFAPPPCLL